MIDRTYLERISSIYINTAQTNYDRINTIFKLICFYKITIIMVNTYMNKIMNLM